MEFIFNMMGGKKPMNEEAYVSKLFLKWWNKDISRQTKNWENSLHGWGKVGGHIVFLTNIAGTIRYPYTKE